MDEKFKVRVTAEGGHEDGGIKYKKGDIFETDRSTVQWMEANGVGELVIENAPAPAEKAKK